MAQTRAQFDALTDAGYKFHFVDPNTPEGADYISTPWNAMRDLRANQEMGVFPTNVGFGSDEAFNPEAHPLLQDTGLRFPIGRNGTQTAPVLANDLFRTVHDAFGHGLEGAGFRARGEENAFQAHAKLYTGDALRAAATETRGQNSYVNFGPDGEHNLTASPEDTIYAPQKATLLPDFVHTEGIDGAPVPPSENPQQPTQAALSAEQAASKGVAATPSRTPVAEAPGDPVPAATPAKNANPYAQLIDRGNSGTAQLTDIPTADHALIKQTLGRFGVLSKEVRNNIIGKNSAQIDELAKTANSADVPAMQLIADRLRPSTFNRVSGPRPNMVGNLNSALHELQSKSLALKNKVLGDSVPLRFDNARPGTSGHTDLNTILIGAHVLDPYRVTAHEIAHVVAERALKPADRKLVRMSLDDGSRRYKELQDWAAKQPNSESILNEIKNKKFERLAYYFEAKHMGDLKPSGLFGQALDKMSQYVERVGNVFKGHGFTNLDDLVHATYEGKLPLNLRAVERAPKFNRLEESPTAPTYPDEEARNARMANAAKFIEQQEAQPHDNPFRALANRLRGSTDSMKGMLNMAYDNPELDPVRTAAHAENADKVSHMLMGSQPLKGWKVNGADEQAATKLAKRMNMQRIAVPDTPEGNAYLKQNGISDKVAAKYHQLRGAANRFLDYYTDTAKYKVDHAVATGREAIDSIRAELSNMGYNLGEPNAPADDWYTNSRYRKGVDKGDTVHSELIGHKQAIDRYLSLLKSQGIKELPSDAPVFGNAKTIPELRQYSDKLGTFANDLDTTEDLMQGAKRGFTNLTANVARLKGEGYIPSMSEGKYHVSLSHEASKFTRAINTDDLKLGTKWANDLRDQMIKEHPEFTPDQFSVNTTPTNSLPESMKMPVRDVYSMMEAAGRANLNPTERAVLLHSMLSSDSMLNGTFLNRADTLLPDEDVLKAIHTMGQRSSAMLARQKHAGSIYEALNNISNPDLRTYANKYIDYQRSQLPSWVHFVRQIAGNTMVSPMRVMGYNLFQNLPLSLAHLGINGGHDLLGYLAKLAPFSHDDIMAAGQQGKALGGLPASMRQMLYKLETQGVTNPQITQHMFGYDRDASSALARLRNAIFMPAAAMETKLRRATAAAAISQAQKIMDRGGSVETLYKDAAGKPIRIRKTGDAVADEEAVLKHAASIVNSSMQTYDKTNLRPVYAGHAANLMSQFSEPTLQAISSTMRLMKSHPVIGGALGAYFATMAGMAGLPAVGVAKSLANMGIAEYNRYAPLMGGATTPNSAQTYQNHLADKLAVAIVESSGGKVGDHEFWVNALNNGLLNAMTGEDIGAFASLGNVGGLSGIDLQSDLGAGKLADLAEGPYLSALMSGPKFASDVASGQFQHAMHDIPVTVLKRLALGIQSGATGEQRTASGQTIPVTPMQSVLYALGVDPARVSNYYNNTLPEDNFAQNSLKLEHEQLSSMAKRVMSGEPGSAGTLHNLINSTVNWNRENAAKFGRAIQLPNFMHAALPYVMPMDDPLQQYYLYHNLYGLI